MTCDQRRFANEGAKHASYTLPLASVGRNHLSAGHALSINSVRFRERRPAVKTFGYLR